jgi:hypothetical protein
MTQRRLLSLHLLARSGFQNGKLQKSALSDLATGNWDVSAEFAEQAIGAEIHLHESQSSKSWKAGRITAVLPSATMDGRYVFHFKVDPRLERTQREAWGNEQARVWEGEE